MESLGFLNLQNNAITKLPHMLGLHTKLKSLNVQGNPIKAIRLQIIDKGSDAVMKYLRDKFNEAEDAEIEPWAKVSSGFEESKH